MLLTEICTIKYIRGSLQLLCNQTAVGYLTILFSSNNIGYLRMLFSYSLTITEMDVSTEYVMPVQSRIHPENMKIAGMWECAALFSGVCS